MNDSTIAGAQLVPGWVVLALAVLALAVVAGVVLSARKKRSTLSE